MKTLLVALVVAPAVAGQMPQNPSPMTDSTRPHTRLARRQVKGGRWTLGLGELLITEKGLKRRQLPLVVHLHGEPWLAEQCAAAWKKAVAVIAVDIGAGSAVYARPFSEPGRYRRLLEEAEAASGVRFRPIVLTSFSAGYGGVREILGARENWDRVDSLVLADSLHTGYRAQDKPGPIETGKLAVFLEFARAAAAGSKRMLVTHSEVFPGTFASTTETADYLVSELGLRRRAVLRWGPLGTQQVSQVRARRFLLMGFAGNTAPDHLDHLHALETWLKRLPR